MRRPLATLVFLALICRVLPMQAELTVFHLGRQVDTGRGRAITNVDAFLAEGDLRFARTLLRTGKGAGGYYYGLSLDFTKTPTGSVDLSRPGTVLRFAARYFQGAGNTNPYGDAPIAAQLRDANGHTANLGILYGPRPVAQYPAWVTCVADVRAGTTTTFEFARVTGVAFSGTDWAGKGGDFVDIRYVAFITPDAPMSCDTFAEARSMKDGTSVKLVGLATMANSPDAIFAIEDYWRNLALPVRELAGRPKIQAAPHGRMVVAAGTVQTDPTSQTRYLSAKWWTYYGSESAAQVLKPKDKIAVRCEDLAVGSKDFHARCLGHEVELTARVTGADAARGLVFLADPASGTAAPSVAMTTSAIPCWQRPAFSRGDLVTVTGVCCLTPGPDDTWQPLLRVRARKDVTYHFAADNQPKTIRVFVLSCDPRCPAFGNKRTHEIFGWSDPRMLAAQFIQAILESSNGWARYEIARWHDADWGNNTPVLSTCDDWLYNWPMLQGATTQRWVASVEWGGGAMDKHHIWWLNHIPKAAGVGPDGKQNNWWKYICDYNTYVP